MSAPERFQVGDTVRCVDPARGLVEGGMYRVTAANPAEVQVGSIDYWFFADRFELVRPTPPALDPFAWEVRTGGMAKDYTNTYGNPDAIVAWSRFCYWATSVNIAAHFLPTTPAARTRASNGRDVPVLFNEDTLRADIVKVWGEFGAHVDVFDHMLRICRRALGGEA